VSFIIFPALFSQFNSLSFYLKTAPIEFCALVHFLLSCSHAVASIDSSAVISGMGTGCRTELLLYQGCPEMI